MLETLLDADLVVAVLALVGLAGGFGALLGFAGERFRVEGNPVVENIDALLPQTQCGQCGYPGCRPYAEAIGEGEEINKCPPGGEATIAALADLLGREVKPLDGEAETTPRVAFIREEECIGCTKCIQACPVDAILGAARHMHTVIADECTGCDLCLEPCPVDCIDMLPRDAGHDAAPPLPAGPGHRPVLPTPAWGAALIASDRPSPPEEARHG
ncbi:electron transport complex subunit RsxB [Halomonas stenophila]|uniref:Ion-translocating oxidoreductase complex subunit B n=1 Tax=Halomonas stenophila TaxID=795312 RepID=A0A7W5HKP5_9GAMM|nr:electron transport complex subunit RsxB [Halomonas stenophila]MBB3232045.1 electron transport complex protein RnfB [Halomonas stenophila]